MGGREQTGQGDRGPGQPFARQGRCPPAGGVIGGETDEGEQDEGGDRARREQRPYDHSSPSGHLRNAQRAARRGTSWAMSDGWKLEAYMVSRFPDPVTP